jgi:hypothetical protein
MTEEEWLACTDPQKMLEFVRDQLSDRKMRLFAVACCRRIWEYLPAERDKTAVEVAERYADGTPPTGVELREINELVTEDTVGCASYAAAYAGLPFTDTGILCEVIRAAGFAADYSARAMSEVIVTGWNAVNEEGTPTQVTQGVLEIEKERTAQSTLLRDILGNPFRSLTLDPSWLTTHVIALAQAIYDDRAFDRMPILADALEEAGCTNQDILTHCRSGGDHVRGCWVVDLVLGKE